METTGNTIQVSKVLFFLVEVGLGVSGPRDPGRLTGIGGSPEL